MERDRFEELVIEAVESLPERFKESLENITIIVEDWPSREQLEEVGLKSKWDLLGLYEGIPLTKRGRGYNMVLPDRITIFQKPIERRYKSEESIIRKIQSTVRHEVAHYFGISDRRLREIDRY
ncbi:MAG: metallopeptidase family protein [Dehalococcoidia bacterium]